jgi:hypothetical protein
MVAKVLTRFFPLLVRLFPVIEPFLPRYISSNLRRQLKKWKESGLILDYKVRTRRLGRLHYKIAVDMDLTGEQMAVILRELSNQAGAPLFASTEEVMLWLRKRKVM